MSESIKRRTAAMQGSKDPAQVRKLVEAALVDLTALLTPTSASIVDYTAGRAEIVKLVTDIAALAAAVDALAAKLNADGGVTDEDYSIVNVAALTAANPAAVTAVASGSLTLTS